MKQREYSESVVPTMLALDLVSQDPSTHFAWTQNGRGRVAFQDRRLCYRRNKAEYSDRLTLAVRLKQGYEYEFRINLSKITSSVMIAGPTWLLSVNSASVEQEFSTRFVAESARTEIHFQTPNDWWGQFEISSASLVQLTLPPRDFFAGTLNRTGAGRFARAGAGTARESTGPLDTVVCTLTPQELPALIANLQLWRDVCPPYLSDETPPDRPQLALSFSCGPRAEIRSAIDDAIERCDWLKRWFSAVTLMFCDLPPEKDVYVREPRGAPPRYGYKAGPNWLFYETMSRLKGRGGMVFLMECDCRPTAPGWLDRLAQVAAAHSDAWVVGGVYSGVSGMDPAISRHINGNALYNLGDPHFQTFLEELWDWMQNHIQEVDPNLAYDCAWETFVHATRSNSHEFEYSNVVKKVSSKFRHHDFIVNLAGQAERDGRFVLSEGEVRELFPDASFVHGSVAQTTEHCRGSIAIGKEMRLAEARPPQDGARRRQTVFDNSFWLTRDSFRANDQIEFRVTASGGLAKDWSFKLLRLDGAEIALDVILRRSDETIEFSVFASPRSELKVAIFKATSASDAPCRLTELQVGVERSERTICEPTSLL